jgi:hypothetical protein
MATGFVLQNEFVAGIDELFVAEMELQFCDT